MSRLSIRAKLALTLGLGALAMLITGITAIAGLSGVRSEWDSYLRVVNSKQRQVAAIRSAFGYGGGIHHLANYVLRGATQPEHIAKYEQSAQAVVAAVGRYRTAGGLTRAEMAELAKIEELVARYQSALDIAIVLHGQGRPAEEVDAAIRVDDTPYLAALDSLDQELQRQTEARSQAVSAQVEATTSLLAGVIVATIAALATAGALLARSITGPLAQLVRAAERLAAGETAARAEVRGGGEIGALAGRFNAMAQALEERIAYEQAARLQAQHASQAVAASKLELERSAAEQARLQGEVIRAQQAALAELSTPLIPITDRVAVMPLIGAMDTARAQLVTETLLRGVQEHNARTVIIDITGVVVVDTQVASALVGAAEALRLLGARAVITGIRPEVAQALVGLGVDLSAIVTRGSLQAGIAYAQAGAEAVSRR
jgi:anti-anti-sigma regulatory factor/HAMP domain-containing protein